jgi:23S rRNA pseudouridine955/2504/2580 synthase
MARDYNPSAQVCHRLDKETSGILVISKNEAAYRHMAIQLQDRKVDKIYHAVVNGIHDFHDMVIEAPIQVLSNGIVKISPAGKFAQTLVDVLEPYKLHSLIRCKPVTGRMHQIRIHLSSINAPIVNDPTYHGKPVYLSELKRGYNLKKGTEELPLIKRSALHALKIRFLDENEQLIEVEAPYPKDFKVLVKQLSANQ